MKRHKHNEPRIINMKKNCIFYTTISRLGTVGCYRGLHSYYEYSYKKNVCKK
jgi:hypothetical protein